jgi:serine/threonine protein kinase
MCYLLPVTATVEAGAHVGGFRVDSLIARGGMGVVYRATDLRLQRPVALKLLAPELVADSTFRDRFLRESQLAAAIDHPNIIPIYEAGEADDVHVKASRRAASAEAAFEREFARAKKQST